MARTIAEIKKSMTDRFMADAVIREKYGFLDGDTFDSKFSKVSFENIIFFIVAASIYALESLFDLFKAEVDSKITSSVMASIPWYHKKCLEFQYGDELVYDEKTMSYGYAVEDDSKRPVRYASVRDNANGVDILVSCEANGHPYQLPGNVLRSRPKRVGSIILYAMKSQSEGSSRVPLRFIHPSDFVVREPLTRPRPAMLCN